MLAIELIIAVIFGFIAGVIVNALSDNLPYRRDPSTPHYADGTPRPLLAWSGLLAFALGKRLPENPQPNEEWERIEKDNPKLGWRYPLTELLSIFLMILTVFAAQEINGMTTIQLGLYFVYMAIFTLIIVIDVEHKLILFVVIIPSMALALLDAVLLPQPAPNLANALSGGALGFGVFFALYLGGYVFTYILGQIRGQKINEVAFGYGDVMMITFSGFLLGFSYTVLALFITVFLGAFVSLGYIIVRMLLRNRYRMFTALPYGPYIVIATIAMLLYGAEIRRMWIGY